MANYSHSTRLLAATTLRNVLGTRNLSELLTEREAISHTMQTSLDIATDPWGVQVERVEMFVTLLLFFEKTNLNRKFDFTEKMSVYRPNCNGLWQQRQRLVVKLVPK